MDTVRVRFEPEGVEVDVGVGVTVHQAAAEAGVALEAPCGGLGRCGSCRVEVVGGVRPPGPTEREALSGADLAAGVRLGCLARVSGPGPVTVRRRATREPRIVGGGSALGAASPASGLGAAIDLGTTTVALTVRDLSDGRPVESASALNPQVVFGHDVLTRVSRAMTGDGEALRGAVIGLLARLLRQALPGGALDVADLHEIVVVGNTAMVHLLLDRDVTPLASAPHEGALVEPMRLPAREVGLPAAEDAMVFIGPGVSAFVGADAVAGALAVDLPGRQDPTLLIDLGTNGELLLRAGDATFATSAAAGPAMEGVSISSGMRAEAGAIERVVFADGALRIATVEGEPARGLCGSGLIDAVAALLDAGVLDRQGAMESRGPLAADVSTEDGIARFELAPGVFLTQPDVRAFQLAKAAVAVAIDVLLDEAGLTPADVREVIVAGGFGSHVSPRALVALGVLPAEWEERVTFRGNTALEGATTMLVDPGSRARALELARGVRTVPLATRHDFQKRFLAALDFPDRTT